MSTIYGPNSPYYLTPQTSWYLSYLVYRAVPQNSSDSIITITKPYEYRPDSLSNDLYHTVNYWWIFMVRNPDLIQDPIWDQVAGLQIYVPSLATLQAANASAS